MGSSGAHNRQAHSLRRKCTQTGTAGRVVACLGENRAAEGHNRAVDELPAAAILASGLRAESADRSTTATEQPIPATQATLATKQSTLTTLPIGQSTLSTRDTRLSERERSAPLVGEHVGAQGIERSMEVRRGVEELGDEIAALSAQLDALCAAAGHEHTAWHSLLPPDALLLEHSS